MRLFLKHNLGFVLLAIVSIVAVIRFSWFLQIHSVNLLYADQWALYEIFSRNPNVWDLITFQYGPHRQGIGYVITWLIAALSGWNVRVEILTLILTHIGTFFLLLALKHKLFPKWQTSDIIIPIVLFSLKYFEAFVIVPNISHGELPLFLISLMAFVWTSASKQKYMIFACIGILTIFTGFGIVALPAIFALLISKYRSSVTGTYAKKSILAAGAVTLAGTISYFYRYVYAPAVDCVNPFVDWVNYPIFIGKLTRNFLMYDIHYIPIAEYFGLGIFVVILFIFAINLIGLFRRTAIYQPVKQIQFLFLETTLMFVLLCTVGRSCLGIDAAGASRYLLYFIPAAIAGYFMIIQLKSVWTQTLMISALLAILVIGEVLSMPNIIRETLYVQRGKNLWLSCYEAHPSISYCNKTTSFEILPPFLYHMAEKMLNYTKEHNLHIYRGQ